MLINDLNNYLKENNELLKNLKENAKHCYDRIDDALRVMIFITAMNATQGNIDEDLTVILETGASYIEDTLETIKIYLKNYFNNDIKEFKKFDNVISYLLYFEDITETLTEKKLYKEDKLNAINHKLENIVINKLQFTDDIMDECDTVIIDCAASATDVYTTYEIFGFIADELGV